MLFFSTRWPGEMHVARATISEALDREPSAHVFFDTHVPWLEVNDTLPKKYPQASVQTAASAKPIEQ